LIPQGSGVLLPTTTKPQEMESMVD
ncbi:MAG: hypothetical protein EZS28_037909, partial [Streblomastix strix]